MSTITDSNLIPTTVTPVAGQRVVKVAQGVWIPVGFGGNFAPGSGGSSDSSFQPRAGVIVEENGVFKVQPLSFEGTQASDSGSTQSYNLKIFNTGHEEPDYGGSPSGGSMNFYKCSYVNSDSWGGYKAVLDNGIYKFESDSTEGLTYTDIVPQVSKTYSADTLVQADLYKGIPTRGLKLYIPFDYGIYAKTGQTITQTAFPASSGTFKGVPSTLFTGTCQLSVVPWANWLTSKDSFTIFIWVTYTYPSTAQSRALNAMQQTGGTELSIACWKQSRANAYLSNVAKGIDDFAADTWWWGCISHDASTNTVQITNSQGSTSGTVTLITSDNNLYIAGSANKGSSTRHQGRLAALRVYNRVLSSAQITALSQEFTPTT